MSDYLTTREVQEYLKVDRITIYRMLNDGRLKGVKIGQQWRFSRRDVDRLVTSQPEPAPTVPAEGVFPVHCVQTIQDLFAEIGGTGALVVDADGEPVTQVSHACSFCQQVLNSPQGQAACRRSWQEVAAQGGGRCHAGLLYFTAPIHDHDGAVVGTFLAGQYATANAGPTLTGDLNLPAGELAESSACVPVLSESDRPRVEGWPAAGARAVESILSERTGFIHRLQKIADLTQLP